MARCAQLHVRYYIAQGIKQISLQRARKVVSPVVIVIVVIAANGTRRFRVAATTMLTARSQVRRKHNEQLATGGGVNVPRTRAAQLTEGGGGGTPNAELAHSLTRETQQRGELIEPRLLLPLVLAMPRAPAQQPLSERPDVQRG